MGLSIETVTACAYNYTDFVGWLNFNSLIDGVMTRVRTTKMSRFRFTMYFNEVHVHV